MAARDRKREVRTPPELAVEWGCTPGKVLNWIRSGELPAVNLATRVGGRPRWVVTLEAKAQFERARANHVPPKPTRRRLENYRPIKEFF
jgi:hypothetical protein